MARTEVRTPDGRRLAVHVEDGDRWDAGVLLWHHGTPHTGAPLAPVVALARDLGLRHVTYARPGYGGSTPQPGRRVADAAGDVAAILSALGVPAGAVIQAGASGGGPHALAVAAAPGLGDRLRGTIVAASPAPYDGTPAWFDGMRQPGALRAAAEGRAARAAHVETFDPETFLERDHELLQATWRPLLIDATEATIDGDDGQVDDDVAFASAWGFDPATITSPVTLLHGADDRMVPAHHAHRLHTLLPAAHLDVRPGDGHISILAALPDAVAAVLRGR